MIKLLNINKLIFSVAVIFLLSLLISAQQKSALAKAAITTDYGLLFISNSKEKSFTLEIRGKNIEPLKGGNNPAFIVDGKLLQVVLAATKDFVTDVEKLKEEEILEKHKIWESEYLGGKFGKKLDLKMENVKVKDFKTLFWGFERPLANEKYDRDYLLTTIVGKNVLALSTSVLVGEKVSDYQKFLVATLATLKISDEPFDIQKLADEISRDAEKTN